MDLRRVDLNLLVAFDALVSEGNVTRAAERVGIGQSAMSSTLGRLRRLLNDPVLVREGRGLVATPLAESLAEPVRSTLRDIEALLSQGRAFDPARDVRSFTVLVTNYHLTLTLMHPLLAELATTAPYVHIQVHPTGDDFLAKFRRQEADLLIVPREMWAEHHRHPHQVLLRDRYVVAVDRDHPDVGEEITYEQLCTLPYIATWTGSERSYAETQLDLLGVARNLAVTTEFGIAPFLLRGTRLITVVHERLARAVMAEAGIRVMPVPVPELEPATETMVWSRRTEQDPGHQWLRGQLIGLARRLTAADER